MLTTDRHGLRRCILLQFLLLLSSPPSTTSMTDRHRHNGPSRVFIPKHFNSWNLGTGITSLNFTTNLQDGPSQASYSHTWSNFPIVLQQLHYAATYGPSQARRTVISSVGGLFCISSLKIFASSFGQNPAKQRETYIKISTKRLLDTLNLRKKY